MLSHTFAKEKSIIEEEQVTTQNHLELIMIQVVSIFCEIGDRLVNVRTQNSQGSDFFSLKIWLILSTFTLLFIYRSRKTDNIAILIHNLLFFSHCIEEANWEKDTIRPNESSFLGRFRLLRLWIMTCVGAINDRLPCEMQPGKNFI